MPDLDIQIIGVEAAVSGLVPLLSFEALISDQSEKTIIHAVMLHAEVRIESPGPIYSQEQKEKLIELFGAPAGEAGTGDRRFWGHSETSVRGFTQSTTAVLPMPCTYDLNVAGAEYLDSITDGEVELSFLFSGTIFYQSEDGRFGVEQIPWNKECRYRMPVRVWKEIMDRHYGETAWLSLRRSLFDRLSASKRSHGCGTWDELISFLLAAEDKAEAAM
jgi:hypothetical protein